MLQTKNTKGPVVLISQDIVYTFPFGYAYLAGYLIQQGEEVKMLFRPNDPSKHRAFAKEIMALKPALVGFGTLYPDLYAVREIIEILNHEGRDFPVIIGGQMVTPTPEFAMEITGADYGCVGEGEIILDELIKALRQQKDTSQIKGLVISDGQNIFSTGPGQCLEMTKLPPIPYELFPAEKWLNIGRFYVALGQPHWRYHDKVVAIHGGRGCPFHCNFCYHHSRPRYRPIPDMMAEAAWLIEKYDANMLYFGDDLVLATPDRARELTEAIKKLPRKIEYSVSCRFDILNRMDDELLREMKRTGCRIMGLGVESGSQRILDAMNKKITVQQILTGFRRLKDAGILPTASIMVGQTTETQEDVEESIKLMLETLKYDKNINYAFTITTPFPGTELYKLGLEKGIIKNDYDFYEKFGVHQGMMSLSINLSLMNDAELMAAHKKIILSYKRVKSAAIGKTAGKLEVWRNRFYRVYLKIDRTVFQKLPPNKITAFFKKNIDFGHDLIQEFLEAWWLKELGLEASFKKIIKNLLPPVFFKLINGSKNSENYKILKNPNLTALAKRYKNTWQNDSLPQKQLKLVKKQLPNFTNVAPMKSLVSLLKKIETKNKKLLEIGCSSGYYSEVIQKAGLNLKYEGCDYSAEFIKLAKELYPELKFKIADATNLDYQDQQFDIVISGCCLLHIIDYEKAICEASRVAKDFVVFHRTPIITKNPTIFAEKTGYGIKMLEIFFNEDELKNLFKKSGLEIIDEDAHAQFSVKELKEPVIMKSYLCKKTTPI